MPYMWRVLFHAGQGSLRPLAVTFLRFTATNCRETRINLA